MPGTAIVTACQACTRTQRDFLKSMLLETAAALIVLPGLAHSVLGERYILVWLFRRPVPALFGGEAFTRNTLRFVWHLVTLLAFGPAAVLVKWHAPLNPTH